MVRYYGTGAYGHFKGYVERIYAILDEGKADGSIRSEVNNRVFRNLVLGAFSHLALRWIFAENESQFDKLKEINEVVRLLILSIANEALNGGAPRASRGTT